MLDAGLGVVVGHEAVDTWGISLFCQTKIPFVSLLWARLFLNVQVASSSSGQMYPERLGPVLPPGPPPTELVTETSFTLPR